MCRICFDGSNLWLTVQREGLACVDCFALLIRQSCLGSGIVLPTFSSLKSVVPARGIPSEERHAGVQRAHLGQHHTLLDFEREHFHPLNATPDRPCTAFFKPPGEYSAKHIFDSLLRTRIAANAVRCLHKRSTSEVVITFSKPEYREHFLQHSPSIERRCFPTHPDSEPLVFLIIYDAPYELSDDAIEHRLRPFCKVFSCRPVDCMAFVIHAMVYAIIV